MEIAFYLPGKLPVFSFPFLLAIGSSIGLFTVALKASNSTVRLKFNSGLGTLFGALIIGRWAYIGIHWSYFKFNPWEIPQFWLGGQFGSAALAGGLLSIFVIARLSDQNPGELADALRPLMTAVVVSACLGCWLVGCFYGPEVKAWWGIPTVDEWGRMSSRWPLQIVCALIILFMSWSIDWINARRQFQASGMAATLGVFFICLVFLGAAVLRVDPVPKWNNISLNTIIYSSILFFIIIALFAMIRNSKSTLTH